MSEHVERLARRVADDPFFLAPALAAYAASEAMDDNALAARLGCAPPALALLRLCRMPRAEPPYFTDDVERIAARFAADADALAESVRRGQALLRLRQAPAAAPGALIAARDGADGAEPPAGGPS